jgi:hypothetical protein
MTPPSNTPKPHRTGKETSQEREQGKESRGRMKERDSTSVDTDDVAVVVEERRLSVRVERTDRRKKVTKRIFSVDTRLDGMSGVG